MEATEQYRIDEMEKAQRVIRESQLALKRQKYSPLTRVVLYVVAIGFSCSRCSPFT